MTRGSENSLGLNGIFKLLVFRELQVNGIDALFWGKEIADTLHYNFKKYFGRWDRNKSKYLISVVRRLERQEIFI